MLLGTSVHSVEDETEVPLEFPHHFFTNVGRGVGFIEEFHQK